MAPLYYTGQILPFFELYAEKLTFRLRGTLSTMGELPNLDAISEPPLCLTHSRLDNTTAEFHLKNRTLDRLLVRSNMDFLVFSG